MIFGTVQFGVTASLVVGSVPAVLVGSYLSSRAPDRFIRPIITFVIFASGLKYVGVGTTALGWILCLVALAGGAYWLYRARPWENGRSADSAAVGASPGMATSDDGSLPASDGSSASDGGSLPAGEGSVLPSDHRPVLEPGIVPANAHPRPHPASLPSPGRRTGPGGRPGSPLHVSAPPVTGRALGRPAAGVTPGSRDRQDS